MAFNSDIRQNVILALESTGADAGTVVLNVLEKLRQEQEVVNEQGRQSLLTDTQRLAMTEKLQGSIARLSAKYGELNGVLDESARLQAKLAAMEARTHDEAADKAHLQNLNDEAELQAHLAEMERKTAEAAKEGANATVAAHARGTQAVNDHAAAVKNSLAAEEAARVAAIKASGDRAQAIALEERRLEELAAQVARMGAAWQKEANAEAWVTRQTTELSAALEGMAQHERDAATATEQLTWDAGAWARSMDKAASSTRSMNHQIDTSTKSSKQAAYGMLAFSYAAQDFVQSGLPAVMNNIPMMVMAMGGSSGLAGATMIAAAAFQAASPYMEGFGKKIGALRDPMRDLIGGVAGLEERIKSLSDKPFKIAGDYRALREMREELRVTKAAIAEWEALKAARSEGQESAKSMIDEGIKEGGGQPAVEAAILEAKKKQGTLYAGSTLHGDLAVAQSRRKNAADLAKNARKNLGGLAGDAADLVTEHFQAEVERIRDDMDKEAKEKIATTVSSASRNEGARKELEDLYLGNKDIFAKHGVTNAFGAGIVGASAENVKAAKDNKREAKEQEDEAKRVKRRETEAKTAEKTELDRRIAADVAATKKGFDDQLQSDIFNAIPGGSSLKVQRDTADKAASAQRAELIKKLRFRGVAEDIVGRVADIHLDAARNEALNKFNEGDKPKFDKAEDAAEARASKAAATARAKQVRGQRAEGAKIGAAYVPQVQGMLAEAELSGASPRQMEQFQNGMQSQLRRILQGQGMKGDQAQQEAWGIVLKGVEQYNEQTQRNFAMSGNMIQALQATYADAVADMQRMGQQQQQDFARVRGFMGQGRQGGATRPTNSPSIPY